MARYFPSEVPFDIPQELGRFLREELARISATIDSLANGEVESLREVPSKDEALFVYSDGSPDLGDGEGFYARIDGEWYKVNLTAITGTIRPATARMTYTGYRPTVS